MARFEVAHAAARAAASDAASRLEADTAAIRLSVRPRSAAEAQAILNRYGARYDVQREPGRVGFAIANPGELTVDEHPFARELPTALEAAGVATIAFDAP